MGCVDKAIFPGQTLVGDDHAALAHGDVADREFDFNKIVEPMVVRLCDKAQTKVATIKTAVLIIMISPN